MTDCTFPQLLHLDPYRRPDWRWERAQYLIDHEMYYSRKRDDIATGIAVKYLRVVARRSVKGRKRRIRSRFGHIDRARREYEEINGNRLEIETRMLARQSDTAIGYQVDLPPETIQAYRDLFFDIQDRIDLKSYILHIINGPRPSSATSARSLMQLSAYFQGPEVIEPWMAYFREGWNGEDLSTERDRLKATIDITVEAQQLSESPLHYRTLERNSSVLLNTGPFRPISVATAFSDLCSQTEANLPLPVAKLQPFSYFTKHEKTRRSCQRVKSVK